MKRKFHNILLTGGSGFIGSHLVDLLVNKYTDCNVYNLDALTYAANLDNLVHLKHFDNYHFIHGNICDFDLITQLVGDFKIDCILHLAAESHVDRSIINPHVFVQTNVLGTLNLLNVIHRNKKEREIFFYYISTDEVFGSLSPNQFCSENMRHQPGNPYSASKSSAEMFVTAYSNTFNIPYLISYSANNYGPMQFPDKLIPLVITNISQNKMIPIHGSGYYQRDWLWVKDHCKAIDLILHNSERNNAYCIGGDSIFYNIEVAHLICDLMDTRNNEKGGTSKKLIKHIDNRQGNDTRYAVNNAKIKQLGWFPSVSFEVGLAETICWYLDNPSWFK